MSLPFLFLIMCWFWQNSLLPALHECDYRRWIAVGLAVISLGNLLNLGWKQNILQPMEKCLKAATVSFRQEQLKALMHFICHSVPQHYK